jgi:hypothetical protein
MKIKYGCIIDLPIEIWLHFRMTQTNGHDYNAENNTIATQKGDTFKNNSRID